MISRLSANGVLPRLLSLESLCSFSTVSAAAQSKTNCLLNCLTSSLGFSEEEALSTLEKIGNRRRSRKEPNLVVNFFLNLGLNKTQIKSLVSVDPKLLLYDVDKTLLPKIQALQDVGLSESDLAKILMNYKSIFSRGRVIRPCVDYLRILLGSDEKVAIVIKKYSNLLDPRAPRIIESNVELLQRNGFSRENVCRLVVKIPRIILRDSAFFEGVMNRVENDLGISRESKMFYHGFIALAGIGDAKFKMKFEMFRSLGLSDATIYKMLARFPNIALSSEDKIRKAWNFYTNELGYAPEYVAARPVMLSLQLERRVKPRSLVVKVLTEKKLNKKKINLYTALLKSESEFIDKFLLPYKRAIPGLYRSYLRIVAKKKVENL